MQASRLAEKEARDVLRLTAVPTMLCVSRSNDSVDERNRARSGDEYSRLPSAFGSEDCSDPRRPIEPQGFWENWHEASQA